MSSLASLGIRVIDACVLFCMKRPAHFFQSLGNEFLKKNRIIIISIKTVH